MTKTVITVNVDDSLTESELEEIAEKVLDSLAWMESGIKAEISRIPNVTVEISH